LQRLSIVLKSSLLKKLYLFALLLLSGPLFAQKNVDLDRFRFSVQYRDLPQMPVDSTYRTYHVEVETTQAMQYLIREMTPERSVLIEGWKKLSEDGHIGIQIKLGDLLPESFSIKERTEPIKGANGVITGNRTLYRQEVVYTFSANAVITDYKGLHIMDQELAGRQYKKVYRSPEFPVKQLAEGYFMVNSLSLTRDLFRSSVNEAMHSLSTRLSDNFGFREVSSNDFIWIIDSRKNAEYEANRKAAQLTTEVLFSLTANESSENIREKLKPAIDYYERMKSRYTSSSKHDRKIRYASYFNLAVIYYYLDDPMAMLKEAKGLELNDYDAKDARGFVQTATWLKNLFEKNNIYTRHFTINPNNFRGPYEKQDMTSK
jgi:hypothetical protein